MHFFRYRNGHLYCEDVDLARVAEEFDTPTFVYSAGTILDHYTRLDGALAPLDHLICYAVKANTNRSILKLFVDASAGFDIVSGGELYRVLAAGGDPAKCTFAGVGKSREEIKIPNQVLQHWWWYGNRLPVRTREWIRQMVARPRRRIIRVQRPRLRGGNCATVARVGHSNPG